MGTELLGILLWGHEDPPDVRPACVVNMRSVEVTNLLVGLLALPVYLTETRLNWRFSLVDAV